MTTTQIHRTWMLLVFVVLAGCTSPGSDGVTTTQAGDETGQSLVQDLESQVEDLRADIADLEGQLDEAEDRYGFLEDGLTDKISVLNDEVDRLVAEADRWTLVADEYGYQNNPADYGWSHAPTLSCDDALVSNVRDTDTQDVQVGPIVLGRVRQYETSPTSNFEGEDGRHAGLKVLLALDAASRAMLVVPEAEKDNISIGYAWQWEREFDPSVVLRPISDGNRGVVFEACPNRETHFSGGFYVAGARCADLDVYLEDTQEPTRITLGFGVQDCDS